MANKPWLPRDEHGWRVPAHGTKSRQIYDLMSLGVGPTDIASALRMNRKTVSVHMHRIRHPEECNEAFRVDLARRRGESKTKRGKRKPCSSRI